MMRAHYMGLDMDDRPTVDRAIWQRIAAFARPHWMSIGGFLVASVAASFIGLVPPLLFKQVIDVAIPRRDLGLINVLAITAVTVAVANQVVQMGMRWLSAKVGEGVIFDLRTALFDRVQRMPIAFFTRTQTGALISRLNNDVVGAQSALTNTLGGIVQSVVTVLSTLAVMLRLEWRMTLLALIVLPVYLIASRRAGGRLRAIARERMNLNASMHTTMTERFNVAGALLVKLFGRFPEEYRDFSDRAARVRDTGVRQAVLMRSFYLVLGLVTALATAGVWWLGARLVVSGAMELGTIVAFALYVERLYAPLQNITSARVDLLTAAVSFERVFEILDLPQAITEAPDAKPLPQPRGRVSFENVSFRYPSPAETPIGSLEAKSDHVSTPGGLVLRDVSFEVEPGTMTALVGPSGAGKTTISALVPRLYDVTSGAVRFDGVDVRELQLSALAESIGIVTQDAHLFHESIRSNLLYAKPDASEAELISACKAARIHDLIASLPDGYDTTVGDRGYRLSGGEKQRVAIARVLLKDPAFVILDEATSHLDSTSEALIQQALGEVLSSRSSLVIAHRLSTVIKADEILVVDGGRIVERGRHGALVAAAGLYAELYRTQFESAAV
jgi:ATP-binding cassette, subfamily B, bacterial